MFTVSVVSCGFTPKYLLSEKIKWSTTPKKATHSQLVSVQNGECLALNGTYIILCLPPMLLGEETERLSGSEMLRDILETEFSGQNRAAAQMNLQGLWLREQDPCKLKETKSQRGAGRWTCRSPLAEELSAIVICGKSDSQFSLNQPLEVWSQTREDPSLKTGWVVHIEFHGREKK